MCFVVKYRHKVFRHAKIKEVCEAQMRRTAAHYGIEIKEIGFEEDHVHLLVSVKPAMSPADIAHKLKGASAFFLLKIFPWLRRHHFWCGHFWSPAYFFDSVGEQTYERLENYVRNQGS